MQLKRLFAAVLALGFCSGALADRTTPYHHGFERVARINVGAHFSVSGGSLLRHVVSYSEQEKTFDVVLNLGEAARFARVTCSMDDGTILRTVWDVTHSGTQGRASFYPKIVDSGTAIVYGHEPNETVYCIEVASGRTRWTKTGLGLVRSTEVCDVGIIAGTEANGTYILALSNGAVRAGWPVAFNQYYQLACAGDVDGDGQDEICLDNTTGAVGIYKRDGSLLKTFTSGQSDVDQMLIGDFVGDGGTKEILIVVDDDSSETNEGDEVTLRRWNGSDLIVLDSFTLDHGAPSITVAAFHADTLDGLQIEYSLEGDAGGAGVVGMLSCESDTLTEMWKVNIPNGWCDTASAGGNSTCGDFDGDGFLEVAIDSGEDTGAVTGPPKDGLIIVDRDGNFLEALYTNGWNMSPNAGYSNGDIRSTRAIDWDSDGRADLMPSFTSAITGTGTEVINVLRMRTDYGSRVIDRVRGHWQFEEASGTRADTHLFENLTDNNTVTTTTGKLGTLAVQFTRANSEYLSRTNATVGDIDIGPHKFAACGWAKCDSSPSGGLMAIGPQRYDSSSEREFALYRDVDAGSIKLRIYNSVDTLTGTVDKAFAVSNGTWFFWDWSVDPDSGAISLNINRGTAATATLTAGDPNSGGAALTIGRFDGTNYFDGAQDSITVWHGRIPTSGELDGIYNGGAGLDYPFVPEITASVAPRQLHHLAGHGSRYFVSP